MFIINNLLVISYFISSISTAMCHEDPFFDEKDIFTSGQEGYHTFRIPSIIVSKTGVVLAFCEGRVENYSDYGNIDLVLKRSFDNGITWGALQVVWDDTVNACQGPTPVVDTSDGTIWLLMSHKDMLSPSDTDRNMSPYVTSSTDDGATWAEPVDLSTSVKGKGWKWLAIGPGVGIQCYSGRLLIPCDYKNSLDDIYSYCFYSDDHGATWAAGDSVGTSAQTLEECQVVELLDGTIMLNARNSYGTNRRAIAISNDEGESWSEVTFDQTLIEPECQASFLRFTCKRNYERNRILFSNPADDEERIKMTVRLSYDEGKSWPVSRLVYDGPSSYSCLTVLPDMTIACMYEGGEEHRREKIAFARFNLEWLTCGKDSLEKITESDLKQNYPNPFNLNTTISFKIVNKGNVTIDVYNITGQNIDTVMNKFMEPGTHSCIWEASRFSSGVYFYTIRSGVFSKSKKMMLLK